MLPAAKLFIVIGALAAAAAVALGAFGAHALRTKLSPDLLAVYRTGVEYHFYHALGLVLLGLAVQHLPESGPLKAAGWAMLAGIVLFSGSLYVLALTGIRTLGAVTPVGGVAFIVAWALFAWAVLRTS
jgi:uncharacterized membrane protein YgdD (TMEM256/DUF423 family)